MQPVFLRHKIQNTGIELRSSIEFAGAIFRVQLVVMLVRCWCPVLSFFCKRSLYNVFNLVRPPPCKTLVM